MATGLSSPADRSVFNRLRKQLAGPGQGASSHTWATGLSPLDALLPQGGVQSGTIIEWLGSAGGGASTLVWLMARHLQQKPRNVVVIDSEREFFPPGVAGLGIDLSHIVVIQPPSQQSALWALEQSLRSRGESVVIARLEHLPQQTYRRLKLATERGGGIGLFLRPSRYAREPAWADVRVVIQPQSSQVEPGASLARRVRLKLLHVRGGGFQQRQTLMSINDDASVVSVDSELAHTTNQSAAARAS